MKTQILLIAVVMFLTNVVNGYQIVGEVGTANFTVEESVTTATYTQDNTGITFSGSLGLGDTLGGLFTDTPQDWSSYSTDDFGAIMSLNGPNPNLFFTIEFYDSNFNVVGLLQGTTETLTSSNKFAALTLASAPTLPWNDIVGLQYTWDGLGSIDATWEGVGVVPEPSTLSLFIIACIGIASILYRKRYRHN